MLRCVVQQSVNQLGTADALYWPMSGKTLFPLSVLALSVHTPGSSMMHPPKGSVGQSVDRDPMGPPAHVKLSSWTSDAPHKGKQMIVCPIQQNAHEVVSHCCNVSKQLSKSAALLSEAVRPQA